MPDSEFISGSAMGADTMGLPTVSVTLSTVEMEFLLNGEIHNYRPELVDSIRQAISNAKDERGRKNTDAIMGLLNSNPWGEMPNDGFGYDVSV